MCDTIVALGSATRGGVTLFGKNSDREPDEPQNVEIRPGGSHAKGETVDCTYLTIPEAEETYRVLLCRPFWMFGAEMGANEHGVIAGNEALFTREKPDDNGLLGMDLLRLGLERGRSALEAMNVMIALLEEHGQSGKGGYRQNLVNMNSFIIADASEAYVLETVKRWWAWKKVEDTWSISNIISLGQDFDACSPGLIDNAVKKGWCKGASDFNFRECYSDFLYTWGSHAKTRERRSRDLLLRKNGELTTADFMAILRDHGPHPDWLPHRQKRCGACVHATNKITRPTQSTCALVGKIGEARKHFYTTAAANPCMSPFLPVFADNTEMPAGYSPGGQTFDEKSFWWRSEKHHREAIVAFKPALASIEDRMKGYEGEMIEKVESDAGPLNQEMIDAYFERVSRIVAEWGESVGKAGEGSAGWLFRRYWRGYSRLNGVP